MTVFSLEADGQKTLIVGGAGEAVSQGYAFLKFGGEVTLHLITMKGVTEESEPCS